MLYKSRNFINMAVTNVEGKKMGFIKDILMNFDENKVTGFCLSPSGLMLAKIKRFSASSIAYFNRRMIISNAEEIQGISLSDIKKLEIIDGEGNIIGIMEDIIFDDDFRIRAFVISPGIINKIIIGKRIISARKIIIGEKNIIYYGNDKYCFYSVRHAMEGSK